MIVIRQKMIYRADLVSNPHVLYIFGDNLERKGFGGQAKEMRGHINAFGIATKRRMSHGSREDYFYDEDKDAIRIIDNEFERLANAMVVPAEGSSFRLYEAVIIPLDGIGTGLSKLPENAPKLLEHINKKLHRLELI